MTDELNWLVCYESFQFSRELLVPIHDQKHVREFCNSIQINVRTDFVALVADNLPLWFVAHGATLRIVLFYVDSCLGFIMNNFFSFLSVHIEEVGVRTSRSAGKTFWIEAHCHLMNKHYGQSGRFVYLAGPIPNSTLIYHSASLSKSQFCKIIGCKLDAIPHFLVRIERVPCIIICVVSWIHGTVRR